MTPLLFIGTCIPAVSTITKTQIWLLECRWVSSYNWMDSILVFSPLVKVIEYSNGDLVTSTILTSTLNLPQKSLSVAGCPLVELIGTPCIQSHSSHSPSPVSDCPVVGLPSTTMPVTLTDTLAYPLSAISFLPFSRSSCDECSEDRRLPGPSDHCVITLCIGFTRCGASLPSSSTSDM